MLPAPKSVLEVSECVCVYDVYGCVCVCVCLLGELWRAAMQRTPRGTRDN